MTKGIDYRASGQLLGSCKVDELSNGRSGHVILVDRGEGCVHRYVVAVYQDGAGEWDCGRYLGSLEKAGEMFANSIKRHIAE